MKKKKLFKRIVLVVLSLLLILVALPFLLKDTLIKKYIAKLNADYNLTIAYNDVDVSLLKNFPSATLTINDLVITTEKPFKNDTLFFSKSIFLDINIKDVFKTNLDKIKVKELTFKNSQLNLLVNKESKTNYEIKKTNQQSAIKNKKSQESEDLYFAINQYNLKNVTIIYNDKKNKTFLKFDNLNHTGKGGFSALKSDLTTKTIIDALTFKIGNVAYFNKAKIDLDAVLEMDFNDNKFTFKENNAKINDLTLNFDGFVKQNKNTIDTDILFHSPKANFKSILSLIPSAYSKDFSGVTASGIATISGFVKGISSATKTPLYSIKIKTTNAQFKYPDLPKQITNISFDGNVASNNANNNPFLNIKNLKFTIDKDTFEASGKITNLTTNPTFNTKVNGTLNLENLTKAYPIELDRELTGVLKADFTTQADQNSVKNNFFDKIKTNGTANLQDFSYSGQDVANIVYVKNTNVKFNTNTILLTSFNAKTGKSDMKATGTLDNLYAFLFNEKKLKGNFNVQSNNFVVSDFLVDGNENISKKADKDTTSTEHLKIPDFLDVTTKLNAKTVVYDDLILKDVSVTMRLKNQKAILNNVKAKMLNGDVAFNGIVDTKNTPTVFDLDMLVNDFDIAKSFTQLETFKKLIPIAKALQGKYDTSFKIKGKLNDDFSPNINTISGNAIAQIFVNKVNANANPLLQALTSNLNFLDLNKLNLENLKAVLSFKNGRVSVKPFAIKHKDITMHVNGDHGFDASLLYDLKVDLPAKYLGDQAVNLLSKLTNINKDTIKIPLNAFIKGTVLKPNVKANFKQAMKDLSLKVAKYQKNKIVNQVTEQVTEQVGDIIKDTTVVKDVLDIIKTNKPKDSTNNGNNNDIINEGVNNVLNNLFKKKKKKDTVK